MGRSAISLDSAAVAAETAQGADDSGSSASASERPDPKRFSKAALAMHVAPVTARPKALGEGRNKRFSLVLAGRNTMKKQMLQHGLSQEGLERGAAAGKLSEILGREIRG